MLVYRGMDIGTAKPSRHERDRRGAPPGGRARGDRDRHGGGVPVPGPDGDRRLPGSRRWCRSWSAARPSTSGRSSTTSCSPGRTQSYGVGWRPSSPLWARRRMHERLAHRRSSGRDGHPTRQRPAGRAGPGGDRADRAAVRRAGCPSVAICLPGVVQIGLSVERPVLDVRIEQRVAAMWAAGLVDEVARLAAHGLRDGVTALSSPRLPAGAGAPRRPGRRGRGAAQDCRRDPTVRPPPGLLVPPGPPDQLARPRSTGPGRGGPGRGPQAAFHRDRRGRLRRCTVCRSRRATGRRTTSSCWWTATTVHELTG